MTSPLEGPTSLNSRPLLSYSVLGFALQRCDCADIERTYMIMLLSPNLSFSRCLASLSRTRIPAFGRARKFREGKKKYYALTLIRPEVDRLLLAVAEEGPLKIILFTQTSISYGQGSKKRGYVSLTGKENRSESVNGRPLRLQYVNGVRPIQRYQFYHGTGAVHNPPMRPIIDD